MKIIAEELNFDVYQRFQGLLKVIESLPLIVDKPILDVGGYPGTMAELLSPRRVITVDKEVCPRADYIVGSGEALPFSDKAFELVLSSDTLEHIPVAGRRRFLSELMRVSKKWLIIAAPFDSIGVRQAEELVNDLYRFVKLTDNPWLREHIQYGLPKLAEVGEELKAAGFTCSIVLNGELLLWFIIMQLQIILELIPDGVALAQQLSKLINLYWREAISPTTPAYRKIVVANRGGGNIPPSFPQISAASADSAVAGVTDKIKFLGKLIKEIALCIRSSHEFAEQKEIPLSAATYINQLEKIINHQEEEIKKLRGLKDALSNKRKNYKGNFLMRLLRRILVKSAAGEKFI